MALPLLLGIVPETVNATALFEQLIANIVDVNNYHVTTVCLLLQALSALTRFDKGIIGLKGLFYALSDGGRWDVALALAEQVDYPSLGSVHHRRAAKLMPCCRYMAFNPVEPANGNLWELWDSPTGSDGMDSRNHHMFRQGCASSAASLTAAQLTVCVAL